MRLNSCKVGIVFQCAGQAVPPKFGDYEAQRHWMELTLHTPLQEWYVETPKNPLHWWGIDYPPGSAYQSYLTGLLMQAIERESVALESSRGYESDRSKSAMRMTVLLSDFVGSCNICCGRACQLTVQM